MLSLLSTSFKRIRSAFIPEKRNFSNLATATHKIESLVNLEKTFRTQPNIPLDMNFEVLGEELKENIPVDLPKVTQYGVRYDRERLKNMAKYVANGNKFDLAAIRSYSKKPNPPLITLVKYPDYNLYIWDGHHRALAIYLGGRKVILPEEYKILPNLTYEHSMMPVFEEGYVTPFDPRKELRLADFGPFKQEMLAMTKDKNISVQELSDLISASSKRYKIHRAYETIPEMVKYLKLDDLQIECTSKL